MSPTAHDTTRYDSKRSLTQTLLETLSETGLRPGFSEPVGGRRARVRRMAVRVVWVLAAAVLALALFRSGLPVLDEPVAYLELARGEVEVIPARAAEPSSRFSSIGAPRALRAGAVVATRSSDRAALRLASGPSVRVDRGTRIRFASSSAMVLERGTVYVDSSSRSQVEVRTSLGVVRDIGTQFEVRLDGSGDEAILRVRVREGSIRLEHGDDVHAAGAGVELTMGSDGALTRGTHPVHGAAWDWVLDTATVPEVGGRPLRELLDWAAREGGWELRFAGETSEELASATVVHGDVGGLSLREALDAALQGAEMGYRLEDGVLIVEGR